MNIYLIHQVKDITDAEKQALDKYVEGKEKEGHKVWC